MSKSRGKKISSYRRKMIRNSTDRVVGEEASNLLLKHQEMLTKVNRARQGWRFLAVFAIVCFITYAVLENI